MSIFKLNLIVSTLKPNIPSRMGTKYKVKESHTGCLMKLICCFSFPNRYHLKFIAAFVYLKTIYFAIIDYSSTL